MCSRTPWALFSAGPSAGAGDTFVTMCLSVGVHWLLLLTTVVMLRVSTPPPGHMGRVGGDDLDFGRVLLFALSAGGRWRSLRVVEGESDAALLGESEGPPPLSPA